MRSKQSVSPARKFLLIAAALPLSVAAGCVTAPGAAGSCPGYGCYGATRESSIRAAESGGRYAGRAVSGSRSSLRPSRAAAPLYDAWINSIADLFP